MRPHGRLPHVGRRPGRAGPPRPQGRPGHLRRRRLHRDAGPGQGPGRIRTARGGPRPGLPARPARAGRRGHARDRQRRRPHRGQLPGAGVGGLGGGPDPHRPARDDRRRPGRADPPAHRPPQEFRPRTGCGPSTCPTPASWPPAPTAATSSGGSSPTTTRPPGRPPAPERPEVRARAAAGVVGLRPERPAACVRGQWPAWSRRDCASSSSYSSDPFDVCPGSLSETTRKEPFSQ